MKLENLEGLLEGKLEFKTEYSDFKVIGEKIIFCGVSSFSYPARKIHDYEIVSNITQFRDFIKESLKNKTYKKENEKYLRKFLKVCELWLIDYFSRTTYNVDEDILRTKYINRYEMWWEDEFEISFDEVLKKKKEILKNNEFLALLLKKENLFKRFKTYQYMLRTLDKYDNKITIKFHRFVISFDISDVWDIKHKISIVRARKNEGLKYNKLNFYEVEYFGEIYNEILSVFPKIEEIVKKVTKQYIKKYR